jgi:hypothetical protein
VKRSRQSSIRFLANRPGGCGAAAATGAGSRGSAADALRVRRATGERELLQLRNASSNGRQAADFVSEDDVKRAIQKGEKIYVGPKTIITPSARDIGDPAEVFAKA